MHSHEPTPQLYTNPPPSIPEHSPPAFQPFPARNRVVLPGNDSFAPQSGPYGAEAGSSDAADVRYHLQTRGNLIARTTQREEGSTMQERYLSALPAFTPFPAAAPSSRYAPPPDSRAEPTRPVLPPTLYSEDPSSGPWNFERPTNLVSESSTPAIRYPSGIPTGRPSPFAPPGPLTARPHRPTRESDHTNVLTAKDHLAGRMLSNAILSLQSVVRQVVESGTCAPNMSRGKYNLGAM